VDQPRRCCFSSTSLSAARKANVAKIAAPRLQALVPSIAASLAASLFTRGASTPPTIDRLHAYRAPSRVHAPMFRVVTNVCHDRFAPQKLIDATHEGSLT
jgi:hypothetical protein